MKKIGAVIALFICLLLSAIFVSAADETQIDKAYACLEGRVKTKCSALSAEEQAFSLLALAYNSNIQSECRSDLMEKSLNNQCWPKEACRLRDTSLAIISLDNINSDTSKPEAWLISQTKSADLEWYLEIDSNEQTTCTISYSNTNNQISINENKKINKNAGSCLTLANSNYFLRISDSCLDKNFTISCDKEFISTLTYKKPNSDVWHVSSNTNSAAANGQTTEKLNSLCFKQNNACNYEGSLWATYALKQAGEDIEPYIPYLTAYSEDNEKFGASAFLFAIKGTEDYKASAVALQNIQGFWNLNPTTYSSKYDTALNILALQSSASSETDSGKNWLLSVQGNDGCWNSVRDTAFILYAGWSKSPAGTTTEDRCIDFNYYCITETECIEASGEKLGNFYCPSLKICCSKPAIEKTCSQQSGIICNSDENCIGTIASSSDSGTCCIGTCQTAIIQTDCELNSFICKSSCSAEEETKDFSCSGTDVCCGSKTPASYWWIWLLVILIVVVIILILLRDRIRMLLFKRKTGYKESQLTSRPPFPPMAPRGIMSRPVFRPMPRPAQPARKPSSAIDKELEDTFKKLREMGE